MTDGPATMQLLNAMTPSKGQIAEVATRGHLGGVPTQYKSAQCGIPLLPECVLLLVLEVGELLWMNPADPHIGGWGGDLALRNYTA